MDVRRGFGNGGGKRRRAWPGLCLILLFLFISISGVVLCLRIGLFAEKREVNTVIRLASGERDSSMAADSGFGTVRGQADAAADGADPEDSGRAEGRASSDGGTAEVSDIGTGAAGVPDGSAGYGFEAADAEGVWDTATEIELFHVAYVNGERLVTVAGADGQKAIAPGTENSYTFSLNNTGGEALDCRLWAEAVLSDGAKEYEIPLEGRLWEESGRYLLGTEESWEPLERLNGISEEAVLEEGQDAVYTLEWRWPFEAGRDEEDTFLGDLAVDRDLKLTVTLHVRAEEDPSSGGGTGGSDEEPEKRSETGSPQTGDPSRPEWYLFLAFLAAAVLVLTAVFGKRKKENRDGRGKEKR